MSRSFMCFSHLEEVYCCPVTTGSLRFPRAWLRRAPTRRDGSGLIAAAAERIRKEFGRLDLLVNNAAISNTRKGSLSLQEY
jgi:hypothetical protein